MSFTEVPPVSEAIFSTGVHTIEDPDVEFALPVHIHPYPRGSFPFGFMWGRCEGGQAIEQRQIINV